MSIPTSEVFLHLFLWTAAASLALVPTLLLIFQDLRKQRRDYVIHKQHNLVIVKRLEEKIEMLEDRIKPIRKVVPVWEKKIVVKEVEQEITPKYTIF
jgi:hypothetical protein